MDLEDWALENAASVVANVERHGISITWTEAHRRLIQSVALVDAPVYVEQADAAPSMLDRSDSAPSWKDPGFAEEVACGTGQVPGSGVALRSPS